MTNISEMIEELNKSGKGFFIIPEKNLKDYLVENYESVEFSSKIFEEVKRNKELLDDERVFVDLDDRSVFNEEDLKSLYEYYIFENI